MKCSLSFNPGSSFEALFRCWVRVSSITAILILSMLILAASAKELPQIELVQQAEQGNLTAQFALASRYELGQDLIQDYEQAARWFLAAAKQGHVEAQYKLGRMYDNGRGVAKDYKEGARWIQVAAEQGYAEAQYSLGLMYGIGRGVRQDDKEAVRWLRASAEQGNAYAQFNLGFIYSDGLGVPQDVVQSYVWYDLAALDPTGENAEIATRRRDFLAEKMTGKEISKAQQMAREWNFKFSVNR